MTFWWWQTYPVLNRTEQKHMIDIYGWSGCQVSPAIWLCAFIKHYFYVLSMRTQHMTGNHTEFSNKIWQTLTFKLLCTKDVENILRSFCMKLTHYPMTRHGTTGILYYGILVYRFLHCRDLQSVNMCFLALLVIIKHQQRCNDNTQSK